MTVDLAKLEELLAAATPAPWCEHTNGTSIWTGPEYLTDLLTEQTMLFGSRVSEGGYHDVALVVELRNDAPGLIADSRALSELRAALPGLRIRHDTSCARYSLRETEPECDCPADDHNARIDGLMKETAR